jgi:hypothetical protein
MKDPWDEPYKEYVDTVAAFNANVYNMIRDPA